MIGEAIGTIGYDIESGKPVYEHELGEYNPAITDGERLYLTGYSNLRAFPPEDGMKEGSKKKGAGKNQETKSKKKQKKQKNGKQQGGKPKNG